MENKLNIFYRSLESGVPVDLEQLALLGISADLAVYYVRAGWLMRLSRGVFAKPNTPLELYPSLRFLERRVAGLHVGGKTALDWHGVRHNLSRQHRLRLYGWSSSPLPSWFTARFPLSEYHRLRLFDESPETPIRVSSLHSHEETPLVSSPERAVLELLSEIGNRQPLQEARELLESVPSLRVSVLQELLGRCRQVKTVRLCLKLGQELDLPWKDRLDHTQLPTGSDQRWVGRSKEGLLVL